MRPFVFSWFPCLFSEGGTPVGWFDSGKLKDTNPFMEIQTGTLLKETNCCLGGSHILRQTKYLQKIRFACSVPFCWGFKGNCPELAVFLLVSLQAN